MLGEKMLIQEKMAKIWTFENMAQIWSSLLEFLVLQTRFSGQKKTPK